MNSRERFAETGNLVTNHAERPAVPEVIVTINSEGSSLVVTHRRPLFVARVVHGHTIGGGTSREALSRAKRRLRGAYHLPSVQAWMEDKPWDGKQSRNGRH